MFACLSREVDRGFEFCVNLTFRSSEKDDPGNKWSSVVVSGFV